MIFYLKSRFWLNYVDYSILSKKRELLYFDAFGGEPEMVRLQEPDTTEKIGC